MAIIASSSLKPSSLKTPHLPSRTNHVPGVKSPVQQQPRAGCAKLSHLGPTNGRRRAAPGSQAHGSFPWRVSLRIEGRANWIADNGSLLTISLFGFLLGSFVSGGAAYSYLLKEYKISNDLLTEDIYVCTQHWPEAFPQGQLLRYYFGYPES